ncbi:hypothetical protein [Micromonospora sp. NPDC049679]|uniref:hypothetical protein n=1 Tax=Micromonospora sp. NPDC049679 TaxID=3155920 RepID=UPI0033FBD364
MTVRTRAMVAVTVTLALIAVVGVYIVLRQLSAHLPLPRATRTCTVRAEIPDSPGGTRTVTLNAEQMANAATIAAIGMQRKMPERAVIVALATAFQESKLENLAGGDRDSVGLFQQRPSQGWGSVEEIRDTRYATNTFYAALKKVRGWEKMRVTDAAQTVQRSAFPEAYEQWADESRVLSRALLGDAAEAVACTVAREPAMRGTAAASALANGLLLDWGNLDTATPTELTGVTVSAANSRSGWRYAHWLVSHASDHGVKRVRFGDLEWTAKDGIWAKIGTGATTGTQQVTAEVFAEG